MGSRDLTEPRLVLRRATLDDADRLLDWANDPAARTASLNREAIDRSTHVAWLTARLASADCRIWIGSTDGTPVGVVRFEVDRESWAVVSIVVDPAARGRGVGRMLLRDGLAAARRELRPAGFRAWVRPDNAGSLALFRQAEFVPVGTTPPATPDAPVELLLGERSG